MMKILLIVFAALLHAVPAFSQDTDDDKLAAHYYENGDFEKARIYYERLYTKNANSVNYAALLDCMLRLNDTKEAEKLVKKQMKRFNSNVLFIDLGSIYEAEGDQKAADKAYQEAILTMPKSQGMVIRTANEFLRKNKNELAMQSYQQGKKLLDNQYNFSYEIAGLYGALGDKEKMVSEYLDLIASNEAYLQTYQNALNRSLDINNEDEVSILRNELLRRVQKYPESTMYPEMLTWLFLQQRDFNGAFVQLRGLDKRMNEQGQRLLNLAGLCVNNEAYDIAAKCYNYIIEKGPTNPYYNFSRSKALRAEFEVLRVAYPPDEVALKALESSYASLITELPGESETVNLYRELAVLRAYYLGDLEGATDILNDALEISFLQKEVLAEIKLELAEILIARNYIWDASLLSSQVDKDFKNDIQGYKAKFMNARISYYVGDFEWAQAQLDVLKGSTSKLISNDAMSLSLLITDNLNLDTITDPMEMFARADLLVVQRKFDMALLTLDSITTSYPGHALTDDILMRRAQISEDTGALNAASDYYKAVIADHYFDIRADDALFNLASLYEFKIKDPEKAQEYYKQLMLDFPGSLFVTEARKRFRALRGDDPDVPGSNSIINERGEP
jgi:tetratricopeptide (TPR) repeat protein